MLIGTPQSLGIQCWGWPRLTQPKTPTSVANTALAQGNHFPWLPIFCPMSWGKKKKTPLPPSAIKVCGLPWGLLCETGQHWRGQTGFEQQIRRGERTDKLTREPSPQMAWMNRFLHKKSFPVDLPSISLLHFLVQFLENYHGICSQCTWQLRNVEQRLTISGTLKLVSV